MPSPFPGMDPYLEGYLWPDVHSALAHTIRQQLAPQIQPKYVARLEISVIEDQNPAAEIGIMYPDVEVIKVRASRPAPPETPGDIARSSRHSHHGSLNDSIATSAFGNGRNSRCGPEYPGDQYRNSLARQQTRAKFEPLSPETGALTSGARAPVRN